ncbi:hypothetical protein [Salinisphaera sp.]|uniref:Abi-alpha family protein n=1 Tax=Salinisphaera sp. TaxID=1914330 RepID=UPI003C7B8962
MRDAEGWPVAGSAVRRMADAETWALIELKQRLDALDESPPRPREPDRPVTPAEMLAGLVRRSRGIDPDAALDALYRQSLSQLVPDQVAMLDVLAERQVVPLCHLGASRLPAGPISMTVLSNASSLGREAGVLLREYVPQYMSHLFALGLLQAGPEDAALEPEYELLMADTQLREMRQHVRETLRLYPRTLRASVRLSDYGRALWRDCRPAAEALIQKERY